MFAPEKTEKPKKDIWQAIEDNDLDALKALAQLPEFDVKIVKNNSGHTPSSWSTGYSEMVAASRGIN